MTICPKCGREKISAEKGIIGFPDYRVAGSYVEYCGCCDEPPVMTLSSPTGGYRLELAQPQPADPDAR